MINNIVGHARTIRTTIMVVEYLRTRCCGSISNIHPDSVKYRFNQPNNALWISDIIVETYNNDLSLELSNMFVDNCRAFVAGAGEIWA